MTARTLYMPSTPLNLLVSVAHALTFRSSQRAQLWLIDQNNADSPYVRALKKWEGSPFEVVEVYYQPLKKENKVAYRKKLFRQLDQAVVEFLPTQVAVGSDRRVEFQYVMNKLTEKYERLSVKGLYLDDGLYSYAGRPYKWYKDQINRWLKKLAYGFWWLEPKTVGASEWIDETWLFQPEKAVSEVKQHKSVFAIEQSWFVSKALRHFTAEVLKAFSFDAEQLFEMDRLIFIPHPNNVAKMKGYEQSLKKTLKVLKSKGERVAVKYHPRVEVEDYFELTSLGVDIIVPSRLASEFILPALKRECCVVGDVGTALLSVRWIRPELKVYSILSEDDPFQQKFVELMRDMGIKVIKTIGELSDGA